jgi:hypothetical protein
MITTRYQVFAGKCRYPIGIAGLDFVLKGLSA